MKNKHESKSTHMQVSKSKFQAFMGILHTLRDITVTFHIIKQLKQGHAVRLNREVEKVSKTLSKHYIDISKDTQRLHSRKINFNIKNILLNKIKPSLLTQTY